MKKQKVSKSVGQLYESIGGKLRKLGVYEVLDVEEIKILHELFIDRIRKDGKEALESLFPTKGI